MKKEVIISVLIGLSLGLIITYGVYRFRSSLTEKPTTTLDLVSTSPSPELEVASIISLHNPQEGSVVTEPKLTVTGSTLPDAYVVLFVNDEESVSNSDGAGNFSFQATLTKGANILRVHVVNESNTVTVLERSVIFVDPTSSSTATDSAKPTATED